MSEVMEKDGNNEVIAYTEFRKKVSEVKDACDFLPDVSDDDGYTKSKRVSLDVGKILTSLEAKRKDLKKDSLEYGRLIDSEAGAIKEELEGLQLPHKAAYKELDQLKKQRDADRKEKLQQRVDDMANLPDMMRDSDSEGVKAALDDLNKEECLDFYEFATPALKARNKSRELLSAMFSVKLKQEKNAAELAKLQKEQAERELKERDDRIAAEAREEAERAAAEAKAQAAAAEKREQAAKLQAEEAAKAAEKQAKQVKIDAKKAQDAAVQLAESKAKAEAELVESDRQAAIQAEQEATAKREANKKHRGAINSAAVDELCKIAGLSKESARAAVTAIAKGNIPAISISY